MLMHEESLMPLETSPSRLVRLVIHVEIHEIHFQTPRFLCRLSRAIRFTLPEAIMEVDGMASWMIMFHKQVVPSTSMMSSRRVFQCSLPKASKRGQKNPMSPNLSPNDPTTNADFGVTKTVEKVQPYMNRLDRTRTYSVGDLELDCDLFWDEMWPNILGLH